MYCMYHAYISPPSGARVVGPTVVTVSIPIWWLQQDANMGFLLLYDEVLQTI